MDTDAAMTACSCCRMAKTLVLGQHCLFPHLTENGHIKALAHRREHQHAFAEVADEGHDSHLLHEPFDLAELHHEPVLIGQTFHRLALFLKLPQDFDLILRGLEAHQALHKIHRQSPQVKPKNGDQTKKDGNV